MKRITEFFVCILLCICILSTFVAAAPFEGISVKRFDSSVDYYSLMMQCLDDGGPYAILIGRIYELQRNLKIKALGMESDYPTTTFFLDNDDPKIIREAIEIAKRKYTDEDLYWLSHCVNAEMGCSWMPDWVQRDTASVVLNNSKWLKKSIKATIFTPGKYGCVNSGMIYREPNQKVINNCIYVLEHGSTLPEYVIGQSGYPYGPVYKSYYDKYLGTTTYFWYIRKW